MTSRYGLIGFPLGHSFSKSYFSDKFAKEAIDASYDLFPIDNINLLPKLLKDNHGIKGLNVTIPYKQKVIKMIDCMNDEAATINAVNVIKVIKQSDEFILEGYNTDAPAFEAELVDFTGVYPSKALILGTGGASAAVAYVLDKSGWEYNFVSRSHGRLNTITYHELNENIMAQTRLIINTTPLGMHPDISSCPLIPYNRLSTDHFLFDLVYNPAKTTFLLNGEKYGAKTRNGLGMLYKQAELAWEIWQK
jgi:shikimate dehydrogenase